MAGVQKVRARMAKGPEMRYTSHLDVARTLERALRRAGLPVAYSEGYNPQPRVIFASALALGATSDAEIIDFELESRLSPDIFAERLNQVLPRGLKVTAIREVPARSDSLAARLDLAAYRLRVSIRPESTAEKAPEELEPWTRLIRAFLEQAEIPFKRTGGKRPEKVINMRPLIKQMQVVDLSGGTLVLDVVLKSGSRGNLRPDELVEALARFSEGRIDFRGTCEIHRTGLYTLDSGLLRDLFDAS